MWSCISFLSLPVKERFRKVVSKGLCFRCLESGHRAEVYQKPLCKYCRGKHHSLLHLEPVKSQPEEANSKPSESPSSSATSPLSSSIVASSIAIYSGGTVILQTVPAVLCGSNGCKKVVRCFFDPPLTYLSADPGDYSVITPAQILIGRNLQASPAKRPVFRNTLLEPSLNVFSIITNLSMDFGSVGMLST